VGQVASITIGANTFSVYAVTADPVADANGYFNGRIGADATAWAAGSTDSKKRALATAADWIDRACGGVFSGAKTVSSQAREWPRDGATDSGTALAAGATPNEVAYAEFWLAGQLFIDSSLASNSGTGSNVKIAKAGSASVTFFTPTIGTAADTRLPVTAMDYLKRFFGGASTVYAAGAASGVSTDSAFSPCNFTRSEGFS
jgi:hypothetical protein